MPGKVMTFGDSLTPFIGPNTKKAAKGEQKGLYEPDPKPALLFAVPTHTNATYCSVFSPSCSVAMNESNLHVWGVGTCEGETKREKDSDRRGE